ncbi:MAG: hypothetical protein HQ472_10225 [Ignavibacteria bacterium]|nr:hypothetical protein [Ignavibacteria bacterium]
MLSRYTATQLHTKAIWLAVSVVILHLTFSTDCSSQVGNFNTVAIHGGVGGTPVCAPLFVQQSFLDLHTPANPWMRFDYGICATGAPGRPAGKIGFASGQGFLTGLSQINDFMFVNNDSANHIRIANNTAGKNFYLDLTLAQGTPLTRMTAYADGKFDFNVGNWNCTTGMIRFEGDSWDGSTGTRPDPVIKLYKPTGTDTECPYPSSFAWFIQNSGNGAGPDYTGALQFRSKEAPARVGNETGLTARVTFLRNGNVGINTTTPVSKLHLLDGAVLFNGDVGATPISGAGTRFMWIPDRAAFRAGVINNGSPHDTYWNASEIGPLSWAGGEDCLAKAS